MDKKEVSKFLNHIGTILEIKGENTYKVRAYYNAAKKIEMLKEDICDVVKEGRLLTIPGIGSSLAENIIELVETGNSTYYQNLIKSLPEGLFELLKIPGLGPKKINKLYNQLGISSIGELEYACIENRLIELSGFGAKTQEKILKGIEMVKKYQGQFLYAKVIDYAQNILYTISEWPEVINAELTGSLRRKKELVKRIELIVATFEPDKVMDRLINSEFVNEIVSHDSNRTVVTLMEGIHLDLRAVKPEDFTFLLHHLTGSDEHIASIRNYANKLGLKVSENGIYKDEKRFNCQDEKEFYQLLGLQYIPAELREGLGEIEAAELGNLPELICRKDIQGIFHVHTRYSDGIDSIPELVQACRKQGFKYLGISDHSKTAWYAHGLKEMDVQAQWEEIDALNSQIEDFYIFKGIESEILADGSLDYSEEILKGFDFVIASIHTNFNGSEEEMTNRLIKAIENPYTTMLGHPTGRLLLGREGYPVDMYRIIRACAQNDVIIELNANPYRLDLDWRYCKFAIEKGVFISINPDAHRISGLDDLEYGLAVARKGWLGKENIFNTKSVEEIQEFFKKRKEKRS